MAAGKRITTEEFIERASVIHNGKFDYSKVEYKNTHTKVTIICPIHGEFEQKPNDHLRGNGCHACSGKQRTTADDFIARAKLAIGDHYDFSVTNYKSLDMIVDIICPIHGAFQKSPRLVLQQHQGCPACGKDRHAMKAQERTLTYNEFVERAARIHGSKYNYDKVNYVGNAHKVTITCPIHGDFEQRPDAHFCGQGCPVCGNSLKGGNGGYTFEYFANNQEERTKPAVLYVVSIMNGNELFIKVGITTKSLDHRFNRSEYKNMMIEPILTQYMSLYDAFCIEQHIIDQFAKYRVFSNTKFSGYTECFKHQPDVIRGITEMINTRK